MTEKTAKATEPDFADHDASTHDHNDPKVGHIHTSGGATQAVQPAPSQTATPSVSTRSAGDEGALNPDGSVKVKEEKPKP